MSRFMAYGLRPVDSPGAGDPSPSVCACGAEAVMLTIQILTIEGCPNAERALRQVREVTGRLAPDAAVEKVRVESEEEARRLRFAGSPTILVNGRDIEAAATGVAGLACRRYEGPEGLPPEWMIEAAILRELRPRHILFLCVANSARSQMAEAIARRLAPSGLAISSAGSEPAPRVNPLALRALEEIGIDASAQRPKTVDEVGGPPVDVVITLCSEEVCPTFLGKVCRVHWGFPDPAGAEGTEEARLEAFRHVRDELRRRLSVLFRS